MLFEQARNLKSFVLSTILDAEDRSVFALETVGRVHEMRFGELVDNSSGKHYFAAAALSANYFESADGSNAQASLPSMAPSGLFIAANIRGTTGNDVLVGTDGADFMEGNHGSDSMSGGAGADVMYGALIDDGGYYNNQSDTLDGGAGNDQLYGSDSNQGRDSLIGGADNDLLSGLSGDDDLSGGTGNDTLIGGNGSDVMTGGAGSDLFVVGTGHEGRDTVMDFSIVDDKLDFTRIGISDADTIVSLLGTNQSWSIDVSRGDTASSISLNGLSASALTSSNWILSTVVSNDTVVGGSYKSDHLFGGLGDDLIYGGGGDGYDHLFGEFGNDVLYGSRPDDDLDGGNYISGGGGNDQLYGASDSDILLGGSDNDLLSGGRSGDQLDGGSGQDTLYGGSGSDALTGGSGADRFVVEVVSGLDSVLDFDESEDKLDFTLVGISDAATIYSLLGSNTNWSINVGIGSQAQVTLVGVGAGDLGSDQWILSTVLSNDNIEGTSSADNLFGGLGNDVINAGSGGDRLFGEQGDDVLYGYFAGQTGSSGSDTLDGGAGNDQLFGNSAADLLMGGAGNDVLSGEAGNDKLDGGDGSDSLLGSAGNDLLNGGAGVDTADYYLATTTLTVDLAITASQTVNAAYGLETLQSIENVLGGSASDVLYGDAGDNRLDGSSGADQMTGRAGNDTYVVDTASDVVVERALEGIDTVEATVSLTLGDNLENLTMAGTDALQGTGNSLDNLMQGNLNNNVLNGGFGNDSLVGGGGGDSLIGGAGNDFYVVDSTDDVLTELANEGTDRVEAGLSWTLAANFENLTLTGVADTNGTGNGVANILVGNAGGNVLEGGKGNDGLFGGAGADVLKGGAGNDSLTGGSASDQFSFSATTKENGLDSILDMQGGIQGDVINLGEFFGKAGANVRDGNSGGGDSFDAYTAPANLSGANLFAIDASLDGNAPTAAQLETLLAGFTVGDGKKQAIVVHDVVTDDAFIFYASESASDGNTALSASEMAQVARMDWAVGGGFGELVAANFQTKSVTGLALDGIRAEWQWESGQAIR